MAGMFNLCQKFWQSLTINPVAKFKTGVHVRMKTPRERVEFYLSLPVSTFRSLNSKNHYHVEVTDWPGCFATGETLAEAEVNLEKKKREYVTQRLEAGQVIRKPHNSADAERVFNQIHSIFVNIALETFESLGIDTDKIPGGMSLGDIISGGIKLAVDGSPKKAPKPVSGMTTAAEAVENLKIAKVIVDKTESDESWDASKAITDAANAKKMPEVAATPENVDEPLDDELDGNDQPAPDDASEPAQDAATEFPTESYDEIPQEFVDAAREAQSEPAPAATTESESETEPRSEFYDKMPAEIKVLEDRKLGKGAPLSSQEKLDLRRWKQAESARRRRAARA